MDDEEKTTIDPQWDDGSTTSEQHKVSQRLRALEFGDPPTADPLVPATAPAPAVAKLVVTHGADLGRAFEIDSRKSFTIGRSLDCDVVLTDIAVSRKHFDLRNEDGWWVIADRGSGNGTLVNNDVKNGPFQLVNGDIIEVGTTTLRFDCWSTEIESEVSTISGKRQSPAIASLPPLQAGNLPPPPATLQAADSRLPMMPTRPIILGPHSPTLMGVDPQDSAHLLSALTADAVSRAPVNVARVATHVPSVAQEPAPAPPPSASPGRLSKRSKYILAAGTAVTLATIVAIGFAASSTTAPALKPSDDATASKPKKFTLPVSELKAAPPAKPTAAPNASKPTVQAVKPTVQAAKPSAAAAQTAAPAVAASKPTSPAAKPGTVPPPAAVAATAQTTKPREVAAADPAPTTPSAIDPQVDAVVDLKPKASKSKQDKKRPIDSEAAEAKAESLYRGERFNEAADTLRAVARGSDRATKRSLESKASSYTAFGKAYGQGMTTNSPTQAFFHLRSAANYDQNLGGAFKDEIATRMKQVAPKAAIALVAADKLPDARLAVEVAEKFGGNNDSNVALVKQKLESAAGKLYAEAMADLQDNPSEAKEKFRQIKEIVDANSQWHAKASKQLSGN